MNNIAQHTIKPISDAKRILRVCHNRLLFLLHNGNIKLSDQQKDKTHRQMCRISKAQHEINCVLSELLHGIDYKDVANKEEENVGN